MDFICEMFDCLWVHYATFLGLLGLLLLLGKFLCEKLVNMFNKIMVYVSPPVRKVLGGLIVLLYVRVLYLIVYGSAMPTVWAEADYQNYLQQRHQQQPEIDLGDQH